ncbi:hypothetical protein HDV00_004070 [Rhizophlyctis rosea]|nr:hypothetical protein HDV00_004070 [Rhizophlyctis rosea]
MQLLGGQKISREQATQGVEWLKKAADAGFRDAQAQLGLVYEKGLVVPRDGPLAAQYFEKAHDQGLVEATFKLATLYASGQADPQKQPDMKKALDLYQDAAQKGLAIAQHNIASLYLAGIPANKSSVDPTFTLPASGLMAIEYFKMAATQGLQLSQINLGKMYAEGYEAGGKILVEKNAKLARKWLNACAEQGGDYGKEAERLLKEMEVGGGDAAKPGSSCSIM